LNNNLDNNLNNRTCTLTYECDMIKHDMIKHDMILVKPQDHIYYFLKTEHLK